MSERTTTYEIENMEDAHVVAEILDAVEVIPQRELPQPGLASGSKEYTWLETIRTMRGDLSKGSMGKLTITVEVNDE